MTEEEKRKIVDALKTLQQMCNDIPEENAERDCPAAGAGGCKNCKIKATDPFKWDVNPREEWKVL